MTMLNGMMRRIRSLQRWDSAFIRILGLIEILLTVSLVVTAIYASVMGEDTHYYTYLIPIVGGLGLFQTLFFSNRSSLNPASGILLIAVMWLVSFVIASLPFVLYGLPLVDSFFEGISGYTTTGATAVSDLSQLPSSLLLWRGVIQWVGGITLLLSFTFLLPAIGMGGAGFNSNEFAGSGSDNFKMKVTSASLNFLKVYALLTVAEVVALMFCSVGSFDALCIALSNIPTGGLLPHDESMAYYPISAQAVTLVFMLLGATNFYLVFRAMFKRDAAVLRDGEQKSMLTWYLMVAIIVFLAFIIPVEDLDSDTIYESLWKSIFSVISSGTGTGFSIFNYCELSGAGNLTFIFLMLMFVEFIGGCSGSTTGGIKVYRLMALKSYIASSMDRILHPNAVISIKANGKYLSEESVTNVLSTIFLFIIGIFVGLALIMIFDPVITLQEQFGIVIAAITNAGIAPLDNFSILSVESKVILCFLMWLGRMEMVMVIILFTKGFWTDLKLEAGRKRSFGNRKRSHNR